jgi:hypothetical protein
MPKNMGTRCWRLNAGTLQSGPRDVSDGVSAIAFAERLERSHSAQEDVVAFSGPFSHVVQQSLTNILRKRQSHLATSLPTHSQRGRFEAEIREAQSGHVPGA